MITLDGASTVSLSSNFRMKSAAVMGSRSVLERAFIIQSMGGGWGLGGRWTKTLCSASTWPGRGGKGSRGEGRGERRRATGALVELTGFTARCTKISEQLLLETNRFQNGECLSLPFLWLMLMISDTRAGTPNSNTHTIHTTQTRIHI